MGIHDLALACPLWQFGSNHNRVSISILVIRGEQTGSRRRGEHRKAQIRLIRNLYINDSAIAHSYHLLHQILPKSRFGNTIGRCITECVWQTLRINSSEQRTLEDRSTLSESLVSFRITLPTHGSDNGLSIHAVSPKDVNE